MRVIPIKFPCECVMSEEMFDGERHVAIECCDRHNRLHTPGRAVLDAPNFEGCDCPACIWSVYAIERRAAGRVAEQFWDADNWQFIARLNARLRRATA